MGARCFMSPLVCEKGFEPCIALQTAARIFRRGISGNRARRVRSRHKRILARCPSGSVNVADRSSRKSPLGGGGGPPRQKALSGFFTKRRARSAAKSYSVVRTEEAGAPAESRSRGASES